VTQILAKSRGPGWEEEDGKALRARMKSSTNSTACRAPLRIFERRNDVISAAF
jgi:hypothetical protein